MATTKTPRIIRPGDPQPRIEPWWDAEDPETLVRQMYSTVTFIEKDQKRRRDRNLMCMRLYGNMDYMGTGPFSYTRTNSDTLPDNRVKLNICSSMVDTVGAKISKMKPKVTFLTSGGDFSVREKAKKLQKFVIGAFYENDIYTKHKAMFRDSTVWDIGAIKHYIEGRKICSERVFASELYVDLSDAMYGNPSHMYHVKYVDKRMLAKQFPKARTAIMESTGVIAADTALTSQLTLEQNNEYCIVIEGWRKATKKGRNDGRHVIATNKVVLVDEKYSKDYFPFTFDRWSPGLMGFYGQSLVDRLIGNQIEINKMLRVIQRSFHLGSSFKVFLEYGSKVAKEHLNNDIGSIVFYQGTKPDYYVPQTVHAEYFRHLEWLVKSSYEEAGISQLSAQAKLPTGLDGGSGKAIREYNDLETERFILQAQEYESTFMETARIYIDLARDIGDYAVTAESKRFMETINWNEIELQDNEFVMQMFPTSSLPQTPSGRLAYVRELMQDGFVDQSWALSLLELPDLDMFTGLKTAPLDDILETLEQVLYRGRFLTPEPFQNLQLGIDIFQSAYLQARKDNAPEDRLELIRKWIVLAKTMLDQSQQAMAAMQQPPMIPAGEQLRAGRNAMANPMPPIAGGVSNPVGALAAQPTTAPMQQPPAAA